MTFSEETSAELELKIKGNKSSMLWNIKTSTLSDYEDKTNGAFEITDAQAALMACPREGNIGAYFSVKEPSRKRTLLDNEGRRPQKMPKIANAWSKKAKAIEINTSSDFPVHKAAKESK